MTITRRTPTTSGTTTYTVSAKTITKPTGSAAGDLLVLCVDIKPDTADDATIDQGFTLVHSSTGGTGSQGIDTGQTKLNVFAKVLTGSEGTITLTPGANTNSWCQACFAYATSIGEGWIASMENPAPWIGAASDTSGSSSAMTAAVTTTLKPKAGDYIECVGAMPTDATTAIGTVTCTATGLSGGTVSGGVNAHSSTGQDCGLVNAYWSGFSGTATDTITPSITATTAVNTYGVVAAIVIQEKPAEQTPAVGQTTAEANTGQAVGRLHAYKVFKAKRVT